MTTNTSIDPRRQWVVIYQHAYLTGERISLCDRHARFNDATTGRIFGTIGAVSAGAHIDTCEACEEEALELRTPRFVRSYSQR